MPNGLTRPRRQALHLWLMVDEIATRRRAALRLREKLGREPTDEELSEGVASNPRQAGRMRVVSPRAEFGKEKAWKAPENVL